MIVKLPFDTMSTRRQMTDRPPRRLTAFAALLALGACASVPRPGEPSVRHVAGTKLYEGTPMHLFVFDPAEPRPLDERIRIARRAVAREPGCRWVEAPGEVIEAETRRQEGTLYRGTLLAAPLDCA